MTLVETTGRNKRRAVHRQSHSRTGVKFAVAETRGEELETINQCAVIDHHCEPTRYHSVHGVGPKHSTTAQSMLMILIDERYSTHSQEHSTMVASMLMISVEEQSITLIAASLFILHTDSDLPWTEVV